MRVVDISLRLYRVKFSQLLLVPPMPLPKLDGEEREGRDIKLDSIGTGLPTVGTAGAPFPGPFPPPQRLKVTTLCPSFNACARAPLVNRGFRLLLSLEPHAEYFYRLGTDEVQYVSPGRYGGGLDVDSGEAGAYSS